MTSQNLLKNLVASSGGLVLLAISGAAGAQTVPNAANFANWADLKCYQPSTPQTLNFGPITLSQLNPLLQAPNPVVPDHDVTLLDLKQLCVPVQKNNGVAPTDTSQFLNYFDLACYRIQAPTGVSLPAMILQHRNPVLVNGSTTPPGVLPVPLQREKVSFGGAPSQLCVPVAKNQTQFPIPSNVQRLVQYLDFECFDFSATTAQPPLNIGLTLKHLNPALIQQPVENVFVQSPHTLCVPVNKNHANIPPDVLGVIKKVDLKKYDIISPAGGQLPPVTQPLQITQLDPLLTTIPPFNFEQMVPQQVMLPVQKCNPYRLKSQTIIPPDNFFAGPLYFNLQSNCPSLPRACGGSVALPANTTGTSKCNLLVAAINATCGGKGFTASTPDACASGTFEVADTACTDSTFPVGSGLMLGLSNDAKLFTQEASGTTLPDYEMDIITPSCGGQDTGGGGVIKGNPTGVPFVSGATAGVVFAVDLGPVGLGVVTATVPTTPPGGTPAAPTLDSIVASGVAQLNQMAAGTGVSCQVTTGHTRAFSCSGPSGEAIGTGVQINDTGLTHGTLGGGATELQALGGCVDSGSSRCSDFASSNVVTPAAPVPATPAWAVVGLLLVLGGVGFEVIRRRARAAKSV
jgi:hypothetical protein